MKPNTAVPRLVLYTLLVSWMLGACQPAARPAAQPTSGPEVPAALSQTALRQPAAGACEGRFVAASLDFSNGTRIRDIRTYLSNGSGLAVNDLDGDGDLDLAFASIDHPAAILWNQTIPDSSSAPPPANTNLAAAFESQELVDTTGPYMLTRAVTAVDVDGDGDLDLTFTLTSQVGVSFWRNQGNHVFERSSLPGVDYRAYALAWGDLTGDGKPDLVTASYNTELKQNGLTPGEITAHGGVVMYTNTSTPDQLSFTPQQLSSEAESLSIGLLDLNDDHRLDIWIANDFLMQDAIWLQQPASGAGPAWEPAHPFSQTSYSTMSIDWGDINNSGEWSLFTTDMSPYDISTKNLAAWLPVINSLEQQHEKDDPQIVANMLQMQLSGTWQNQSPRMGLDATGWSWTGRFGDLDSDGFEDLYVVNGMIADNLLGHLPGSELVEENRVFRNLAGTPRSSLAFELMPQWNLGSKTSGRGMVMADLDLDGDLDIVINTMRSASQLFENRLCRGENLLVDLRWQNSPNTHALGAIVELQALFGDSQETTVLRRDVRSSSGYLSGDSSRLHFGFPTGTQIQALVIYWPDGAVSHLEEPSLSPQTLIEVKR